jgi:hypothetical protein
LRSGIAPDKKLASHFYQNQRSFVV